jgi:hypothetical protein
MMMSHDKNMNVGTCTYYLEHYIKDMTNPKNSCDPVIKKLIDMVLLNMKYGVATTLMSDLLEYRKKVLKGQNDIWAPALGGLGVTKGFYEFFKRELLEAFFLSGDNPRDDIDWSTSYNFIENLDLSNDDELFNKQWDEYCETLPPLSDTDKGVARTAYREELDDFLHEFRRQFTCTIVKYIQKPMNSCISDCYNIIEGKKALFVKPRSIEETKANNVFRKMCPAIMEITNVAPSCDLSDELSISQRTHASGLTLISWMRS